MLTLLQVPKNNVSRLCLWNALVICAHTYDYNTSRVSFLSDIKILEDLQQLTTREDPERSGTNVNTDWGTNLTLLIKVRTTGALLHTDPSRCLGEIEVH